MNIYSTTCKFRIGYTAVFVGVSYWICPGAGLAAIGLLLLGQGFVQWCMEAMRDEEIRQREIKRREKLE